MQANTILQSDLIDIIFENRNKQYGAYALRKNYEAAVQKALLLTFVIAASLLLLSFIKKDKSGGDPVIHIPDPKITTILSEIKPDPPTPPKPPELPHLTMSKPANTQSFPGRIKIVSSGADVEPIETLQPEAIISHVTNVSSTPAVFGDPRPYDVSGGGPATTKKPEIDRETPMAAAEVMPSFPGGMEKLRDYLARNLQSPESLEDGQTVAVKVRFVVGYDGKLKGFEILEDGGTAFNQEVVRVLKKMPDWIPGKSKGENVSVYCIVPVKFTPEL